MFTYPELPTAVKSLSAPARRVTGQFLARWRLGRSETLAEHIARSSPAERAEAARVVGVDLVWDTMVAPVIGQRG